MVAADDYIYVEVEGGYRIGSYDSFTICSGVPTGYHYVSNKNPVIPSKYNGKDVVELGRCSIAYTPITSIKIQPPLKKIECYAFDRCYYLLNIELPETLVYIGEGAFQDCTSLQTITLCSSKEVVSTGSNIWNNVPTDSVLYVSIKYPFSTIGFKAVEKSLTNCNNDKSFIIFTPSEIITCSHIFVYTHIFLFCC